MRLPLLAAFQVQDLRNGRGSVRKVDYPGMFSVVIYRRLGPLARAGVIAGICLTLAACSMPLKRFSFGESTGSIIPSLSNSTAVEAPYLVSFVGNDAWPSLKAALVTALVDREDGERVNWKGGHIQSGTVTPIATVTSGDGRRCRRVAITAQSKGNADEMLSEACPIGANGWSVTPL